MKTKTIRKRSNTLNELMIVNPGTPGKEEFLDLIGPRPHEVETRYLGEDGSLYRVANFGVNPNFILGDAGFEGPSLGQYFLGEDGTVYEVINR